MVAVADDTPGSGSKSGSKGAKGEWMSVPAVCALLGIGRRTVMELIAARKFTTQVIPEDMIINRRRIRVKRSEVEAVARESIRPASRAGYIDSIDVSPNDGKP